VKADSDIDICVCTKDLFYYDVPSDMPINEYISSGIGITFPEYKEKIGNALKLKFGNRVKRGDKAFAIEGNSNSIKADVVPTFEYRQYYKLVDGRYTYREGVRFYTDQGKEITNWHDQTYSNGVEKNKNTGWRYKQVVRIVKGLRNEMQEKGIVEANDIGSFLIESLVWNIPDPVFKGDDIYEIATNVILHIWSKTREATECQNWVEVNGIKYLFHPSQPWTRERANSFLFEILNYIDYET
jgi:hypothetical protein